MDDRTQLSSPSGAADQSSPSVDRASSRRPKGSLPGWPVWTPVTQATPWEAVEIPEGLPIRGAADSGPATATARADALINRISLWGREGFAKGGAPMRRLITALSTLATLFVVAGAGWKF